mgnify:CR=1 FL=1
MTQPIISSTGALYVATVTGKVYALAAQPGLGSLSISSTLDGNQLSSSQAVAYTLTNAAGDVVLENTTLPTQRFIPPGRYTITAGSTPTGGPANATLSAITCPQASASLVSKLATVPPSCTQDLASGQTLAFTMQFSSNQPTRTCSSVSLRLYNVDDLLQATISNSGFADSSVLSAGRLQDTGLVDISSSFRSGTNTMTLQLANYGGGWNYGYQLRIGADTIAQDSCGAANTVGCDNSIYGFGLVWSRNITIVCQ